jgi:beta-glucanase (GH16 family)
MHSTLKAAAGRLADAWRGVPHPRLLTLPLLLATAMTVHAAEPGFKLVLEENFDGPELNPKVWNVETGKRRDAMNSPNAVDVKDGKLTITTWTDEQGVTYCGFVTTRRKFFVTQGRAEARCRFSVQPGTQVAFWAQSPTYGRSGDPAQAAQDGVEIDIMETTGLMQSGYQYALHWGSYKAETHRTSARRFPASVGGEWHDYGVEWDDSGYRFTFDGKVVATDVKCPGSRAPQFLLLTSESNVKSWNGERPKVGYGPKDKSLNKFEVDWVRAWERVPAK